MGSFIASLATLIVLAMAGAFAAPLFIDWNRFVPQIENYAADALGRPVRIDGPVAVTLLPEMRIRANRVAILDDRGETPLIQADAIDASISFAALFGGSITAKHIEVSRPVVRLSTDEQGRGNWSRLKFQPSLPAIGPQSLAFNELKIVKGRITYISADGSPLAIDGLEGAVQADGSAGSYRFTGRFTVGGVRIDLNAIAAQSAGQGLLLRATAKESASGATGQFDGTLSLEKGTPRIAGTVRGTAAVMLEGEGGERVTDLQFAGTVAADPSALSFSEASLTLDANTAPQVLNGSIGIDFDRAQAEAVVSGKVLNWKALSAPRNEEIKTTAAIRLGSIGQMLTAGPAMRVRARLAFDQIITGEEIVEQANAVISRVEGRWLAENVSARLPGDTQFILAGTVSGDEAKLSGILDLNGGNFSRFFKWLYPGSAGIDTRLAQKFSLKGAVVLDRTLVSLEGVTGKIGEAPFQGSLRYDRAAENGKLSLRFVSDRLDLSGLDDLPFVSEIALVSLFSEPANREQQHVQQASSFAWLADLGEVDLDVDIAQVDFRSFKARKLLARMRLELGLVDINSLDFETSDELLVNAKGRLKFGSGALEGQMRSLLEARTPAAVRRALTYAGVNLAENSAAGLQALAPARVNLQIVAQDAGEKATFSAVGSLGGSKLQATGALNRQGREEHAQLKPGLSVDADVTALDGEALIGQILTLAGYPSLPSKGLAPGRLTLKLEGPLDRLGATLGIKTEPLSADVQGLMTIKSGEPAAFEGKGQVRFVDAAKYLPKEALLEAVPGAGRLLEAKAGLSLKSGAWSLSGLSLTTPENRLSGVVMMDLSGNVPQIEAKLKAETLNVARVLTLLLDRNGGSQDADAAFFWSDKPFRPIALKALKGTIELNANRMDFHEALIARDATLSARLADGRIELRGFRGDLLGGKLRASGNLSLKQGRIAVDGKASIGSLRLASFAQTDQTPLIVARASATLSFSGEGLSPRGLVSVLSGQGRISLSSGTLNRLVPSAVEKAAATALDLSQPLERFAVEAILARALEAGSFRFRPLRASLSLGGGTLSIPNAVFRGKGERVRLSADVDLQRLQVDSEWQLVTATRNAAWPPVKVIYAGPVMEIASLGRELEVDAFYRAFTIRKMEQDVERLESLSRGPRIGSGWAPTQEPTAPGPARRSSLEPQDYGAAPTNALPRGNGEAGTLNTKAFQEQIKSILRQHQAPRSSSPDPANAGASDAISGQGTELPVRRPTRPVPESSLGPPYR